jgi:hypothetical protein
MPYSTALVVTHDIPYHHQHYYQYASSLAKRYCSTTIARPTRCAYRLLNGSVGFRLGMELWRDPIFVIMFDLLKASTMTSLQDHKSSIWAELVA